jgi:hypothetical protein
MKKIKIKILSVLLFSFAYFVVHDHVIQNFDADTQYELCYAGYDILLPVAESNLDLPSKIHDGIHTLLELHVTHEISIPTSLSKIKPYSLEIALISYTHLVPERPPVI